MHASDGQPKQMNIMQYISAEYQEEKCFKKEVIRSHKEKEEVLD